MQYKQARGYSQPPPLKAESFLELFIKILIGFSAFVPLVMGEYFFPSLAPKVFLFQTIVLLMTGAYVLLLLLDWQRYRPRMNLMNVAVLLFGLSLGVSTLMGADWHRSLWDVQIRMTGVVLIFHYVLYYLIVTSLVWKWSDWQWFFRFFLLAGSLVMFLGLVEAGTQTSLCGVGYEERVSSTIGSPTFFGGYGMFLLFLGYLAFLKEKSARWSSFILLSMLLSSIGILMSGSRSALLGLLVAAGFVFLWYLVYWKTQKKKTRQLVKDKIWIPVVFLIGALLVLALGLFIFCQVLSAEEISVAGRFVDVASTDLLSSRILVWETAIKAWQEKPVFGWGPSNWPYALNKYYPPELAQYALWGTWIYDVHSVPLNMLVTQGIVGLFAYLGLFGSAMFVLQRAYKKKSIDVHIFSIGIAFLIAHFVYNLFLLETPTSYLYFFFFLAFVNARTSQNAYSQTSSRETIGKIFPYGIGIVSLAVFFLIVYANIFPARADKVMVQAWQRLPTDPQEAMELYQKANSIPSPYVHDLRLYFFELGMRLMPEDRKKWPEDVTKEFTSLVRYELQKNQKLHPLDIRWQLIRAQTDRVAASLFSNPSFLLGAERTLEEALMKSPRRQQTQYLLAMVKFELNKPQEAIRLLKESISYDPSIREGWLRLVWMYKELGEVEEAKKIIRQAVKNGVRFTASNVSMLDRILSPQCNLPETFFRSL